VPLAPNVIRVAFDTVIFVRALLNPRSRWGDLVFDRGLTYRLIVSAPVAREIVEVLGRSALARRFSTLPLRNAAAVLDVIAAAEQVPIDERAMPGVSRDPKDDVFLATAATGGADFWVSEDQDLLVLGTYAGVRIVDAQTFVAVLDAAAGA